MPPPTSAYAKIELQNAARLLAARRDLTARLLVLEHLQKKADGAAESAALKKAAGLLARQAPKISNAVARRRRAQASALVRKTIRLLIHSAASESRWPAPRAPPEKSNAPSATAPPRSPGRIRRPRTCTSGAKK